MSGKAKDFSFTLEIETGKTVKKMTRERRELFERTEALRKKLGPISPGIVPMLRELRGNEH